MKTVQEKELNISISNIVRGSRMFHGLQQTEFAAILGVTQGSISKIENATMKCDLDFWFRFLRRFSILDPYCFEIGGIELQEADFDSLINGTSHLMPKYNFTRDSFIYRVAHFKPLYEIVMKKDSLDFLYFLKQRKIKEEVFFILNHPLSLDFLDEFFDYLKNKKINEKSMMLLNFDFKTTFRSQDSQSLELIIEKLSSVSPTGYRYRNFKKNSYDVDLTTDALNKLSEIKNNDLLSNYSILYPYFLIKSSSSVKPLPKIKELEDGLCTVNF